MTEGSNEGERNLAGPMGGQWGTFWKPCGHQLPTSLPIYDIRTPQHLPYTHSDGERVRHGQVHAHFISIQC